MATGGVVMVVVWPGMGLWQRQHRLLELLEKLRLKNIAGDESRPVVVVVSLMRTISLLPKGVVI